MYLTSLLKRIIIVICLGLLAASGLAQPSASTHLFSVENLKEDFKVFREALEECHPGLYWFRSKKEMDSLFDATLEELNHPLREQEFFPLLNKITAYIGCLHTTLAPSKALVKAYFTDSTLYLPIKMRFLNGKAYLYQNLSENPDLIPGSEVRALNGKKMEEILEQMLAYTSSDGYTKGWASYFLQNIFAYRFRFLLDESDQFGLQLKQPDGLVTDYLLRGLSLKEMDSLRQQRKLPAWKAEPSIQLSWNEELHTAILRILRFESWEEEGKKVDFLKFLKQSMEEIIASGAKNLILDVGDRGGGNEAYGLEILSYLIDQPFTGYTAIEFANKSFKSRKYSETSKLEMLLYKTLMRFQKTDSSYLLKNYKVLKPVRPKALHFSGQVYVIASRSTASATSDFVAWVHSLGIAPIIGEETGGGYYGNTSNWEFTISLPHSKIRLQVPLARYFCNVKADIPLGRGIIPDYLVSPSIEDILAGLDPQLEFVFELIKKKTQP